MVKEQHEALMELLLGVKGMVLLSGYPNELYSKLTEAGWDYREWKTACSAAGRTRVSNLQGEGAALANQPRTEALCRNPQAVSRLQGRMI